MIKYVPANTITDDNSFPYDFKGWNYPTDLLRSVLYSVWWAVVPEGNDQDLALLMDYDGFVEWYNANEPKWAEDEGLTDDERFTVEEYLPYHIGRTVSVVKGV